MSLYSFFEEACSSCSLTNSTSTNNCLELFQGSSDLINLCFSACEEIDQLELATWLISIMFVAGIMVGRNTPTPQQSLFENLIRIPSFYTNENNDNDEDYLSMLHIS